jgi:hypothetical protein
LHSKRSTSSPATLLAVRWRGIQSLANQLEQGLALGTNTQTELNRRQTADAAKLHAAISRLIDDTIELGERQRRWGTWGPLAIVGGSFVAGGALMVACLGVAAWLVR